MRSAATFAASLAECQQRAQACREQSGARLLQACQERVHRLCCLRMEGEGVHNLLRSCRALGRDRGGRRNFGRKSVTCAHRIFASNSWEEVADLRARTTHWLDMFSDTCLAKYVWCSTLTEPQIGHRGKRTPNTGPTTDTEAITLMGQVWPDAASNAETQRP